MLKLVKISLITLMCVIVVLVAGRYSRSKMEGIKLPSLITPIPTYLAKDSVLFDKVNHWREGNGRKPYVVDNRLCKIAEERVLDIQTEFNHYKFDHTVYPFNYQAMQENIVAGDEYGYEDKMLDSWLLSASHSATLHKDYIYSCIRCLNNRCVQIFMNP